jgi:hypothetical protein
MTKALALIFDSLAHRSTPSQVQFLAVLEILLS